MGKLFASLSREFCRAFSNSMRESLCAEEEDDPHDHFSSDEARSVAELYYCEECNEIDYDGSCDYDY